METIKRTKNGPVGDSSGQEWHSVYASKVLADRRRTTHLTKIRDIGVLDLPRMAAVLDVACGEGEMLDILVENGFTQLTGVDLAAPVAVKSGWTFVKGSASAMPFKDGEFDAILCAHALHHLSKTEKIRKFMDEAYRCLRPGGTLFLIDHYDSLQLRTVQAVIESPLGKLFPWTAAFRVQLREEHGELYYYLDHWKENREVIRRSPFKVSRWNYKLFFFYYRAVKP